MDKPFHITVITALLNVLVDGVSDIHGNIISFRRTKAELEMALGAAGIEIEYGSRSRLTGAREEIMRANERDETRQYVKNLIENVADHRHYSDAEQHLRTVEYLNSFLCPEGYEIREVGMIWKLLPSAAGATVTKDLNDQLRFLDFDAVNTDFNRALQETENDPEDSVTSACSTVESICKCLLDEMGAEYPKKKDISHLVKEVQKHLNLSPDRNDIENDIKQILNGLYSTAGGIGALRTHTGDAHGRGKKTVRIDPRIARLAIHAASTLALFFIETWQKRQEGGKG